MKQSRRFHNIVAKMLHEEVKEEKRTILQNRAELQFRCEMCFRSIVGIQRIA